MRCLPRIAFSLGIKLDAIRQGLRTFDSTFFQAPGRMKRVQRAPLQGAVRHGTTRTGSGDDRLAQRLDVTGRRIV